MAERRGHEPDLARVRPIARTLLLTPVLVLASGWLLWHAYQLWRPQPSPPLFPPEPPAAGRPHLQTDPRADMRAYHERVQRHLHSAGWVDREAGVVHIPIGRAMDLLVERGLPGQDAEQTSEKAPENDREKNEKREPAAEETP
ncbi:hypothetical protein [Microbulbifer litoralis]|uniref:hypothetical protein n=1 Tax=Microbulbifer litoralis TaxID=2933965 RepID=UPI002028D1A7|nr:hypothetical protein [Microbulbifer sp. GX H0434]